MMPIMGPILLAIWSLLSEYAPQDRKCRELHRIRNLRSTQLERARNQGRSLVKGVMTSVMFCLAFTSLSIIGMVGAVCPHTYAAGDNDSSCWKTVHSIRLYSNENQEQISRAPSGHAACGLKVSTDSPTYGTIVDEIEVTYCDMYDWNTQTTDNTFGAASGGSSLMCATDEYIRGVYFKYTISST